MSKYNIGDPITAGAIITGIQCNKAGEYIYQTNKGYSIPESAIDEAKVDKPEPSQDKPEQKEPIRLYCIKDYEPGKFLTSGNVYEVTREEDADYFKYDGWRSPFSSFDFKVYSKKNPDIAPCLVQLVKRPAKVGEWVYLISEPSCCFKCAYHKGDVLKIIRFGTMPSVRSLSGENWTGFRDDEYLVLDGYQPEPEYYNGKVFCTDARRSDFIKTGYVYEIKNGELINEGGVRYNEGYPVKSLEEFNSKHVPQFIEYKGEAK